MLDRKSDEEQRREHDERRVAERVAHVADAPGVAVVVEREPIGQREDAVHLRVGFEEAERV